MTCVWRDQDRFRLERELEGAEYESLLRSLHLPEPMRTPFRTWGDVLAFTRGGSLREAEKDVLLQAIFRAHGTDRDPRWRAILLAIFWPALEAIDGYKRLWDRNRKERWQNITWAFLEVVCRIDVAKRPERLAQKVINDTVHRLHETYQPLWNHDLSERATDPWEVVDLAGAVDGIDLEALELRRECECQITRLQEHRNAGRISRSDFLLVLGTRFYGESVADHARKAGIAFQVAKKRRQRAEAAIRRYEEQSENACPLPPSPTPLERVEGQSKHGRSNR